MRKSRPREPLSTTLNVTAETAERLRAIARLEDRSMSSVMRRALDLYLSRAEADQQQLKSA